MRYTRFVCNKSEYVLRNQDRYECYTHGTHAYSCIRFIVSPKIENKREQEREQYHASV